MRNSGEKLNRLGIAAVTVFFLWANIGLTQTAVLSLEDCIRIALENNSQLKNTELAFDAAKQDVLSSYQGILPSITTSAGRGKVVTGPSEYLSNEPVGIDPETGNVIYEQRTRKIERSTRESSSASINLNQTIFDGGIWWNQIRKAKTDKKASKYDLIAQRNNTINQIQQAFFELGKQIKLLEVDSLAVARSQAQLERAEQMYELGATAQLDVFRARVNLGNDRISKLQQKNTVTQARKNLNVTMGRDPLAQLVVEVSEVQLKDDLPSVEELVDQAIAQQPMVRKNKSNIKSRKLSVDMAKGLNYPKISAYVNYDRFHEDAIKVFSDFDQNYQTRYGINLSFNLFNGFNDYVQIQKAQINYRTARENYEQYKRELKSNIHQSYEDYKSYLDIIEINRVNLEAAREELRLAEERYQIGAGTALEVREAQVNLTRAEQTLIAAEYNARLILAQLDNYLGLSYKKYME